MSFRLFQLMMRDLVLTFCIQDYALWVASAIMSRYFAETPCDGKQIAHPMAVDIISIIGILKFWDLN